MTWQIIIILQIIAGTLMTLYTRRVTLSVKGTAFGIAVVSYIVVGLIGLLISFTTGALFKPIPPETIVFLIIEGIAIPAAWLTHYKLIGYIGAGNAVIVSTINILLTALIGIVFLSETPSLIFVIGSLLMLGSTILALRTKADITHVSEVSFTKKVVLAGAGAIFFAIGLSAEKVVINEIGPLSYAGIGWFMQSIGALVLFIAFGRKELSGLLHANVLKKAAIIGLLTSIAGGLYIYAVSISSLSATIVATSAKLVLVSVVAAIVFKERNALGRRVIALILAILGLALILL